MPKIIENLEEKLLLEAQRQLQVGGYGAVTVRSVAAACGVGVGTVYNYYPSKDALIATYLLRDWKVCVAEIAAVSAETGESRTVVRCIYDRLLSFARRHGAVFLDKAAEASFPGSFSPYHKMLRRQIAEPLRKFCDSDFGAEFAAEALLTWTMAGTEFEALYEIIEKLF